jgi:hypothetical protein
MARQAGSKVIDCTNKKCDARICGIPGEQVVCKKCGTKIRLTKAILAEQGTGKATPKPAATKPAGKKPVAPTVVKRGRGRPASK